MARGGSFSVTSATTVFQSDNSVVKDGLQSGITAPGDGPPGRIVKVFVDAGSAVSALVTALYGPHKSTADQVPIPAGGECEFVDVDRLIIDDNGGTATGYFSVIWSE